MQAWSKGSVVGSNCLWLWNVRRVVWVYQKPLISCTTASRAYREMGSSCEEAKGNQINRTWHKWYIEASLNTQLTEPCSGGLQQKNSGFHCCQLTPGNWVYRGHSLNTLDSWKTERKYVTCSYKSNESCVLQWPRSHQVSFNRSQPLGWGVTGDLLTLQEIMST